MTCPYCLSERAAFAGCSYSERAPGSYEYIVLFKCGVCLNGVVAKVESPAIDNWFNGRVGADYATIREIWPKKATSSAPADVPEILSRYYVQGMDNLARRNFDAAGMMFRKTLDIATKQLHPDGKGTLKARIEGLPSEIGVTPAMKEWAHQIRDLGNDAAHEEQPFEEDEAKSLQAFTEVFLTYAFTLPSMISRRKGAAA